MRKTWFSGLVAICFLSTAYPNTANADTDATVFLNKSLSNKPSVQREKKTIIKETECSRYRVPRVADGGSYVDCWDVEKEKRVRFSDKARVANTSIVEVMNLKFDEEKLTSLPARPILYREFYSNCADDTTISNSFTLSVTGTKGYSVAKTKGVTTTTGGSVAMNVSYTPGGGGGVGGGAGVSFEFSRAVSLSTTVTESESVAETRSQTWMVSVGPKQIGMLEFLAYQASMEIPFSANVIVDGALQPNLSGFSKASDMLSVAERTMPFEGVLHLSNVSEGRYSTRLLPGKPKCDGEASVVRLEQDLTIPEDATIEGKYVSAKEFYGQLQAMTASITDAAATANGEVHLNEVQDEVIYRYQVLRSAAQCGIKDDGSSGKALFQIEERQFYNYLNGELASTWSGPVETFQSCYSSETGGSVPVDPDLVNVMLCPTHIDQVCATAKNGSRQTYNNQCEAIKAGAMAISPGDCKSAE
jgi:hypothetical protein